MNKDRKSQDLFHHLLALYNLGSGSKSHPTPACLLFFLWVAVRIKEHKDVTMFLPAILQDPFLCTCGAPHPRPGTYYASISLSGIICSVRASSLTSIRGGYTVWQPHPATTRDRRRRGALGSQKTAPNRPMNCCLRTQLLRPSVTQGQPPSSLPVIKNKTKQNSAPGGPLSAP